MPGGAICQWHELTDRHSSLVSMFAVDSRLGKVSDRPEANGWVVGGVARVEDSIELVVGVGMAPPWRGW